MKAVKLTITILLLAFVAATVGTLIAQELAPTRQENPRALPLGGDIINADTQQTTQIADAEEVMTSAELSALEESQAAGAMEIDDPSTDVNEPAPAPQDDDVTCLIEAIYFHNTHRCYTCQKIEADAKAAIESTFPDELAAGRIQWSAINMEEHRAYISQYDLAAPSLVLIRRSGVAVVEWIVLEETWTLVRSERRFSAYVTQNVQSFLETCP